MITTTITVIETGWWLSSRIVKLGKWLVYGTPESPNDKIIKELETIRREIQKLKSSIVSVNNNNEEITKKIDYYTEYTKVLEDSILEAPIKFVNDTDADQKWIYPHQSKSSSSSKISPMELDPRISLSLALKEIDSSSTNLIQSCRF